VKLLRLATALTAFAALSAASGAIELDSALPVYKPVSGVSGNITAMGSDTLGVLMRKWADGFKTVYTNVKIEIESKGSATAPPALTEGAAQFGPMSRPMSEEEIEAFEPAVQEFIKYILSKDGQAETIKAGVYPYQLDADGGIEARRGGGRPVSPAGALQIFCKFFVK
jgi:ABC-type phosphate transport system substrate-binding protein